METSKLKNIVVLNNLPSNIVDEAIIVLKTSRKINKMQKVEQNKKKINNRELKKDKDYILKEAEMLVNSYVSKFENKNIKINSKKIEKKYKKLKQYSILVTLGLILETMIIIF